VLANANLLVGVLPSCAPEPRNYARKRGRLFLEPRSRYLATGYLPGVRLEKLYWLTSAQTFAFVLGFMQWEAQIDRIRLEAHHIHLTGCSADYLESDLP